MDLTAKKGDSIFIPWWTVTFSCLLFTQKWSQSLMETVWRMNPHCIDELKKSNLPKTLHQWSSPATCHKDHDSRNAKKSDLPGSKHWVFFFLHTYLYFSEWTFCLIFGILLLHSRKVRGVDFASQMVSKWPRVPFRAQELWWCLRVLVENVPRKLGRQEYWNQTLYFCGSLALILSAFLAWQVSVVLLWVTDGYFLHGKC